MGFCREEAFTECRVLFFCLIHLHQIPTLMSLYLQPLIRISLAILRIFVFRVQRDCASSTVSRPPGMERYFWPHFEDSRVVLASRRRALHLMEMCCGALSHDHRTHQQKKHDSVPPHPPFLSLSLLLFKQSCSTAMCNREFNGHHFGQRHG